MKTPAWCKFIAADKGFKFCESHKQYLAVEDACPRTLPWDGEALPSDALEREREVIAIHLERSSVEYSQLAGKIRDGKAAGATGEAAKLEAISEVLLLQASWIRSRNGVPVGS